LIKQALWEIYLPAPHHIPWPNFDVPTPNAVHQADLLFLPQDKTPCGRKVFLKGAEASTAAGSPRARVTKEMENHKTAIRRSACSATSTQRASKA